MAANKNGSTYYEVLWRLAKLETFTTFKVTVCEGELNDETKHAFIAPLMFFDPYIDLDTNSDPILNENAIENSTEQIEISIENRNETLYDYPDSSDFSDDE